jgi:hypothetical protein
MRTYLARLGKFGRTARSSQSRRPSAAKLCTELLESRDVPAVMVPTYTLLRHAGGAAPLATGGPTGTSPSQIRHAYGIDQITFSGGTVAGDGSGTTIAIVDAYDDPNIANDLHQFDARFGLPDPSFSKVNEYGGTTLPSPDGSWIGEIALDVEWAHAVAPGAAILLVEANSNGDGDLFQAVRYAAGAPGVVAVSMSWAGGESGGESGNDASTFVTPPGHQGVTFLASSGDSGAPALYPSASLNVISVGGTTLSLNGSGNISAESAWSGSGGGISAYEVQPGYQQGVVTQTSSKRATPDVAYDANPATGFPVYDSYNNGTAAPWVQYGGTSDAAPQWAALVAIADQGRALVGAGSLDGPTQTLPALYQMPASYFHDITTGTTTGSPNYSAGPGYDLATGRGTPVANLLVPALAQYLLNGPRVVASAVGGSATGTVDHVTLTFNEPVKDGTFTVASVDSLTGPGGAITPTGVTKLSNTQYQVSFAAQATAGTYSLTIGPNVQDQFGNAMDQNGNGVNGEDPGDRYTTTFALPSAVALPFQQTFADGVAHGFVSQVGAWAVSGGRYAASPALGLDDAVSVVPVTGGMPSSFQVQATLNAAAPTGGYYSNGFLVFNYQSDLSFDFAGAYVGGKQWVIGHRDGSGWEIDAVANDNGLAAGTDFAMQLTVVAGTVTLSANGTTKVSFAYPTLVNSGAVGVATQGSNSQFANFQAAAYTPPPGGGVLASANFDDGTSDGFVGQAGAWSVSNGRYAAAPASGSGDAVSTIAVSGGLPPVFQVQAIVNAAAAGGGFYSNGFLIFNYQGATSFDFAGTYVGAREWLVGHRDAAGWHTDAYTIDNSIVPGTDYLLQLSIQQAQAVLAVGGATKVSFTFAAPVNGGALGLGTQGSLTQFDNFVAQQPALPFQQNFSDGVAHSFAPQAGSWAVSGGRYDAAPASGASDAVSALQLAGALPAKLAFDVVVNASPPANGFYSNAFLVFDYQSPTNFKFAGAYFGAHEWVIGHRDANGWEVDAYVIDPTATPGTDFNLEVLLQGSSATLLVNGVGRLSYTYGQGFTGSLGLATQGSVTQFGQMYVWQPN